MGTTLTGTTPQTTYDSLIKVTDNGPLGGSLKTLTDGLGNDSALALSTGAASVTGTLAVSSNLTVDTDTLFVDATNNRVGVGTTSPDDTLHLNKSGAGLYNATHYTNSNSTANFFVGIGGSSVPNGGLQNNAYVYNAGASAIVFGTSDTERMRITSAGNVGIGTSSPNRLLTIKNSSDGANGLSFQSYASTSELGYIRYEQTNDILDIANTSGFASGGLKFSTSNTERMRITSAGNVGIGTSSPAGNLHIASASDTGIRIQAGTSSLSYIDLADSASGAPAGSIAYNHIVDALTFATGGSNTERMRITTTGNVGIGTADPSGGGVISSKFTISQADENTAFTILNGTARRMAINPRTTGGFTIYDGGSSAWNEGITQLNGNVGIGTASPASKLDVNGNISTSGDIILTGAKGIYFDNAGSKYLDDYEVGTWTMGVTFGGESTGVTYNFNSGTYTKIGRQVTVNGLVQLSNKGSSTGGVRITGLPFNVANTNGNYSQSSLRVKNISFLNAYQGYAEINTTTIVLEQVTNLGVVTAITDTDFANNSEMIISLTYFV